MEHKIYNMLALLSHEQQQKHYNREYTKAHNIEVVGIIRRNALGQGDVNEQFNRIAQLIRQKRVGGVIITVDEAFEKCSKGKVRKIISI